MWILGKTTCSVLKIVITVELGTQFFAEEKRLTKTGRLKQGGRNKLNICIISLKRQKKTLLKLLINAHIQTFNVQDHIPSLAGLKNDGLSDAIASTPMALACLA